jgi:hypothetical protein
MLRSCTAGCVANFSSGGLLRDVYCCVTTSISLHPGCPPGAARAHNATTSARERCDYRAARRSLRLGSIPRPIVLFRSINPVQLLLLRETRGANYRLLFGVAFGRGAMSTAKKGRERNSTAAYLRDGISPQHLQVRPVSLSLSLLTPARDRPNGTSPRWQCARRSARAGATGTVPARRQRWF